MILAAGLGTRLRPLTDRVPKALVEVGGVPVLERVARRLVAAGAERIVVNVHHHADRVDAFVRGLDLPAEIVVSREAERALETGGGILHAAPLFEKAAAFLVHNGDIVTEIDLVEMYGAHARERPLATLAVARRETDRALLFDEEGLYGWRNDATGREGRAREPVGATARWPFAGIHVIDPSIFGLFEETGAFSIVTTYLRLAAAGHRILPWDAGDALWLEIGTPERLARAREIVATRERAGGQASS